MHRHFILALALASALTSTAVYAQTSEVNPYTGQPQSLEQLGRELETAKQQTAVLEERVKQAQLTMTLNVVPVKEKAELKSLESQAKQASREVEAPAPIVEKKSKPKVEERPVPPPAPMITLSSVIRSSGEAVALLDINGSTLAVHNGDKTSYGPVAILDDMHVRVGLQTLTVRGFTLSRVTVSDTAAPVAASSDLGSNSQNIQRMMIPPPLPMPISQSQQPNAQ